MTAPKPYAVAALRALGEWLGRLKVIHPTNEERIRDAADAIEARDARIAELEAEVAVAETARDNALMAHWEEQTKRLLSDGQRRTWMSTSQKVNEDRDRWRTRAEAAEAALAAANQRAEGLRKTLQWIGTNGCGCTPICRCNEEGALRIWKEEVQQTAWDALAPAPAEPERGAS